ncbi:class I SAM-dependent methyltransferase [Mycobacterium sp.]|uniref:class I SAM-dependent methyltransferase n=1 Tax=Mycobacterium sp. TaxID=1785 RepID=UPI0025FF5050|nr:class I SAM-dependent methyltransferase [Mycobacterium sp.]MBW0014118.1 class I SAM-dependent methyltransferase [Mycobacterium sp.]
MTSSRPISACQICGHSGLDSVLFVGFIPPVNTMPDVGSVPVEQAAFPLEMVRCPACGHVQIGLEVDAEVLFPFSYPYLSGSTRILRENFADLYEKTMHVLPLAADDLVVDIGSNDGTLLGNFLKGGHRVLGIEPSQAGLVARENGIQTLTAYFNQATAEKVLKTHGRARVITAANVFAHIAEPHAVVAAITELLAPDGLFISESHYLLALVETVQYDTIYHEHLRYYHLGSLIRLLCEHGLEVFRVERIPTHGGSIRVFSARRGTRSVDGSVAHALAAEAAAGLDDGSGLTTFRDRVIGSKVELFELLAPLKRAGARIYGIGAPSRASTLINYTGLDDGILDCVLEISTSHKLNKYIPGTRIPVLDEKKLFDDQPEYALLLSWHITDELVATLRSKGYQGRFISPLPTPRIID